MFFLIHIILICLVTFNLNCLPATAQTVDPEKHYPYGIPSGTPTTNDLIVRDIYALSSNDDTKFADWVAYRLDRNTVNGNASTTRTYRADPLIDPDETLEPDDYDGANASINTTRGHQAPLGAFKGTDLWSQTNYLSNLTPQIGDLNGGVWLDLENRVRGIVNQCDVVYVMTGTLYEREMPQLPEADEPHVIPSGYWKIIALNVENNPEDILVSAYIFDQETDRRASIQSGQVTVDEVEERSGLNFFSQLPDSVENTVESDLFNVLDASLRRNNLCKISSEIPNNDDDDPVVVAPPNNSEETIRIISLLPNPEGDESQLESATIKNFSDEAISFDHWKLTDAANTSWSLDDVENLAPGQEVTILRLGKPMALNNGGDTIKLIDGNGAVIDTFSYGRTLEGTPITAL